MRNSNYMVNRPLRSRAFYNPNYPKVNVGDRYYYNTDREDESGLRSARLR